MLAGARARPRRLARGLRARLVVRRGSPELELDAPGPLEDPLQHDPLAAEQVAEPSAASTIAALNRTAPTMSDWMCPVPSPSTKKTRKRTKIARAISARTAAPARKTRSGSYIA